MLDAALGLALVLAACDQRLAERAPAATAPAAPATPDLPAHRPGPAYVAVERAGVFRLEDGRFTPVLAHRFPVRALAVAPDGALIVTAIGGAWRVEDGRLERLDPPESALSLDHLAVGPDGVVWASDSQRVLRWDGAWGEEPEATFDGQLIDGLAVDEHGQAWVLQAAALWRLASDGWHQIDLAFTGTTTPFLSVLAFHPDGALVVGGNAGVFAFRDRAWHELPLPMRYAGPRALAIGPAGHLAVSGGVGTVVLASPTGRVRALELAEGGAARRGHVLAVDGAGRTWLTTDRGVIVLDADGRTLQHWLPGSLPAITGRVTAVAVVGDGPTLPTPGPPRTGTVTGRIVAGDRDAAGATVLVCDLPLLVFTTTPCDGSTVVHRATADRAGRFAVAGVPVGSYGVAVHADDRWRVLTDVDCCSGLATTASLDLGALTLR